MKKILIFTFAVLCSVACMNENDASDILLFITPASEVTASSGDKIPFKVETWTIHKSLASLEIRSFDKVNGSESLLFIEVNTPKCSESYTYTVPKIDGDELTVTLTFIVTDTDGHVADQNVNVIIKNNQALLKEHSSITMFSAFSDKADAFNLTEFKAISSDAAPETDLDIYMYADTDAIDKDTFRPEWRSKTGVKFTRANDMEYPSITKAALNVFWNNSQKSDNLTGISNNDIIIVGRENTAIGVFKIALVHDEAIGFSEDYILLGFKPAI